MFDNPSDLRIFIPAFLGLLAFIIGVELYYKKRVRPYKLTLDEESFQTCIRYRWLKKRHFLWGLLAFLLLFAYPMFLYREFIGAPTTSASFVVILWLIVFGVVNFYAVAAGFINSTMLLSSGRTLVISSQPLPTVNSFRKVIHQVREVYYQKEFDHTRADTGWMYPIYVKTETGQTHKVLDGVDLEEDAAQIKQAIQEQLARYYGQVGQGVIPSTDNRSYIDKLRGYRR